MCTVLNDFLRLKTNLKQPLPPITFWVNTQPDDEVPQEMTIIIEIAEYY